MKTSPGSIHVEAVDVEGEQSHHVRQQGKSKGEAQAGGQASIPQNGLNEGGHQVDVAWKKSHEWDYCWKVRGHRVLLCYNSLIQRWMWYRKKRPRTWSRARFIFSPAGAPISHCSSSSSSLATR